MLKQSHVSAQTLTLRTAFIQLLIDYQLIFVMNEIGIGRNERETNQIRLKQIKNICFNSK